MSKALVPTLVDRTTSDLTTSWAPAVTNTLLVLTGAAFISLMAQIAFPLPFTPVPITGQTLGTLLISLSFGSRRAFATVLVYLAAGFAGMPVFAAGASGLIFGPTVGYLIGMLISSYVVGSLADRGFTRTTARAYAACLCSSVIVFGCGLAVLSYFLPANQLLVAGFLPFIPGDIIKMSIAVALVRPLHRFLKI